MVSVSFHSDFKKEIKKINNKNLKEKIFKQVYKIKDNPKIGKPMRYERKGTRELYIGSMRLSYAYFDDNIVFLTIYHKDEQ